MLDIQPPDFSGSMPANLVQLHSRSWIESMIFLFFFSLPYLIIFLIILFIIGILIKSAISKSSHIYVKTFSRFLLIFISSIIIVLASLYLPKTINKPSQLNNIVCGWPNTFVIFDSNSNLDASYFPRTVSCIGWSGGPIKPEVMFLWQPYLTNVAIIFCLSTGVLYLIQFIYQNVFKLKNKK
jgi:hypothetical protein